MELAILPSGQALPLLLGYLRSAASSEEVLVYSFFAPHSARSESLRRWLKDEFGVALIGFDQAVGNRYARLHLLPGYVLWSARKTIEDQFAFDQKVHHADGWRNSSFLDPTDVHPLAEYVQYGFRLHDCAFEQGIPPGEQPSLTRFTVALPQVREIVQQIAELSGSRALRGSTFTGDDLLVVMRYWGSPEYAFAPGWNIESFLAQFLSKFKDFGRITFRGHSADQVTSDRAEKFLAELCISHGIEFRNWNTVGAKDSTADLLNHPEGHLLQGSFQNLGGLFAFDSSLNWLVGVLEPEVRIIWPTEFELGTVLRTAALAERVKDQVNWMAQVIATCRVSGLDELRNQEVRTPGYAMQRILADMFIVNAIAQR